MTFRQTFEQAWSARFAPPGSSGVCETSPSPVLSCCDAAGRLRSREALSAELDNCRRRIVEIRRSLAEQEFIESFCQSRLDHPDLNGTEEPRKKRPGPPVLKPKRSLNDIERLKVEAGVDRSGPPRPLPKCQSLGRSSGKSVLKEAILSSSKPDLPGSPLLAVPQIEGLYASPADEMASAKKRLSAEVLYSEPVNAIPLQQASAKVLYTNPVNTVPLPPGSAEELYAEPINTVKPLPHVESEEQLYCRAFDVDVSKLPMLEVVGKPDALQQDSGSSTADSLGSLAVDSPGGVHHAKCRTYEEITELRNELAEADATASSDEEEKVANFIAIRQSVSHMSRWCVDGSMARRKLELQAQRLSTRFSRMLMTDGGTLPADGSAGAKEGGGGSWNSRLDALQETLLSPATPSAQLDFEPDWTVASSMLNNFEAAEKQPSRQSTGGSNGPVASSSGPLDMRQSIVTTLLDSEHTYVATLDTLLELKGSLWMAVGNVPPELEALYSDIEKLHKAHYQFVTELKGKVADWSAGQSIGEIMKILALDEYQIAPAYLKNYQRAIAAIGRCRQENTSFDDIIKAKQGPSDKSSVEEMLHKPIVRFERNTLVLHDLIKYTPTGHADYDLLQKTLKLARHFLDNLGDTQLDRDNPEFQRYLVKHGLIVEKFVKERKLRHVFLFNDVLVAAKQKIANRLKDQYEVRWFVPLTELSLEDKLSADDDMRMAEDHKQEVEMLQKKLSELQAEYKLELKKTKDSSEKPKLLRRNKTLEKLRKKLVEQEVSLVIAMPHLQFRIHNRKQHKQFLLMMSSDYERSDWRDTIIGLLDKAFVASQYCAAATLTELHTFLNKQKMPMKASGTALDHDSLSMEEERLYGSLHVLVIKLQGLKSPARTFCRIEVDSFGHFLTKAKTNVLEANKQPMWNECFEVDLDGAQTLRVLCYSHDRSVEMLLGKGALELSGVYLKDEFQEHAIALNSELSLVVSLKYLSHAQTIQRHSAAISSVLFGVPLDVITRREDRRVPLLVTSCLQEIESRGMNEEGLYRISGQSVAVDELKEDFEKNLSAVVSHKLKTADINVLTSVVKLFFRSLPDPLFTEALYANFAEGIGLADPDAKESCLLALVRRLPDPNFHTIIYLVDHLIRVSQLESRNKMGLRNLATVFGPTLLRPANRHSQPKTMEQLFFLAAHEATVQTTVLYQLLMMRSSGVQFDPASSVSVTSF